MSPKLVVRNSMVTLFFIILCTTYIFSQTQGNDVFQIADSSHVNVALQKADSLKEITAYQKADNLPNKQQKIDAFKNFIITYPNSQYKTNTFIELFFLYLSNNNVKTALIYADQAVQSAPEQVKIDIYNEIAYSLVKKKIGLDTATVYAQRAVSESKESTSNYLKYRGISLDIQALVMYNIGKADSALELEKIAITFDKDNPTFLSNLATYEEANGSRPEGLKAAAKAIFFGNIDDALTNFNKWIEKEKLNKKEQEKLKNVIADSTLKPFFEKSKREDKYGVNSTAAVFLFRIKTNLKQANKWIKEALNSLNDNSTIDYRVTCIKNYGAILLTEDKYEEALKVLNSVENLADLRDTDFWYTLGKAYEKVKKYQKALDSYITGFIAVQPLSLRTALIELEAKEGISKNKIESLIEQKSNEFSSLKTAQYKSNNTSGNVLLAELFTSTLNKPCISADYAFENLSEYFTRNEVAILEYHLNMSGFDAMSNPSSLERYLYYGGNFGIPTTFVQGASRIDGGGPQYMTKNKFDVYKYTMEKYLKRSFNVKLIGSAKQVNDSISVNLEIVKRKAIDKNFTLHIALAEKSLLFPGNNGVTKHIFVVRSLFKGASGMPLKLDKGNENVTATFNINEIEEGLTKYLSDPTKDPSWTEAFLYHRKKWMNNLDRNNLAVVVWLQDNKTKEVLQSVYLDVSDNSLSEGNK